jgi:glycerol-3-phosphate acyltransferase PlsX
MTIVLDGYGGDNAPLEVLRGAAEAVREYGVSVTVTGDENALRTCAQENNVALDGIAFAHAPLVMPVDEEPGEILKSYSDCQCARAYCLRTSKATPLSAPGAPGAAHGSNSSSSSASWRKRPALADDSHRTETRIFCWISGATRLPARYARAVMRDGRITAKKLFGIANPASAVNSGTEESKGGRAPPGGVRNS